MASIDIDQLAGLVAPISEEAPTGIDLRSDDSGATALRAIKDARAKASEIERQSHGSSLGSGGAESEEAPKSFEQALVHWRTVSSLAQRVLTERSKDLEVVAYLIEALVRIDGFAGLAIGFRLARELAENYWDNLYPAPDEDGLETRVLPLARLNGDGSEGLLMAPIRMIRITEGSTEGPFAIWQKKQADDLNRDKERDREVRISRGAVTTERISRAAAETSTEFFRELLAQIQDAQQEFATLTEVVDEKCSSQPGSAPPSSAIHDALEDALSIVREITRGRFPDEVPVESPNGQPVAAEKTQGGTVANGLTTREDAFRVLNSVADFFESKDPHCLLAAQVRKVVRLGRMSPAEYFSELIQDETARNELFKLVGIKPPDSESN